MCCCPTHTSSSHGKADRASQQQHWQAPLQQVVGIAGVDVLSLATAVHLVAEQVTESLVFDVRSCTRTESKHDMTRRSVSDTSQRPICSIVLNLGVHTFAEVTARVLTFAEGADGVERAAGLVGGLAAQALGLGCGAAALREPGACTCVSITTWRSAYFWWARVLTLCTATSCSSSMHTTHRACPRQGARQAAQILRSKFRAVFSRHGQQ